MSDNTEALVEQAILDYWGPRCPARIEGCACCDAWAEFDALAAPPSLEAVKAESYRRALEKAAKRCERRASLHSINQRDAYQMGMDRVGELHHARQCAAFDLAAEIRAIPSEKEG